MKRTHLISDVNFVGLAAWKFVPDEPRHNTFHRSLAEIAKVAGARINYLGLKKTYLHLWVNHVLPDSILRKFPYMSPRFLKQIRKGLDLDLDKPTVIYMFEGTLLWVPLLEAISRTIPNSVVVCNLFSSSRYNRAFFRNRFVWEFYKRTLIWINSKKNFFLTFDTELMRGKVNNAIGENIIHSKFPLPSALSFRSSPKVEDREHYRVLVNIRGYNREKLHQLLDGSCKKCVFVFPRGLLANTPLWNEFGHRGNLEFDQASIPVEEYEKYIDQFDYMIFLYEPSIDSSGKLLDALVRNIAVCLPQQATEWNLIAQKNGRYYSYDWESISSLQTAFNHPSFLGNYLEIEPDFTPNKSLLLLIEYTNKTHFVTTKHSLISKQKNGFLFFLHWQISFMANVVHYLASRFRV